MIAAGHDCQPVLFSGSANGWKAIGSLDDAKSGAALSPTSTGGSVGRFGNSAPGRLGSNEAFNAFKSRDKLGTSAAPGSPAGGSGDTELLTIHQNTITSVRPYSIGAGGAVTKVSTTGVDGKLVIWNVVPAGNASRLR